ncbi:hypothetical protein ACFL5V_05190 [Fibrobacterota bacterium]
MPTLCHLYPSAILSRLFLGFFLSAVLMLMGCSSSSHRSRGSLSEAVKKSSDSYKGERKVKSSRVKASRKKITRARRSGKGSKIVVRAPARVEARREHRHQPVRERPMHRESTTFFGFSLFSSVLNMGQLPYEEGGTIAFGSYNGFRNRHSFGLGFGFFPLMKGNNLHSSLVHPGEVHFIYQYRRYTGLGLPMGNLYAKLELAPQVRFWNYRNPVSSDIIDEYGENLGTEIITGDGLGGFAIGTGLGYALIKSRNVEIGLDGTLGFNLLADETNQGFVNDMFYHELFMKMSVEFAFK